MSMLLLGATLVLVLLSACDAASSMTNSWAVRMEPGGKEAADALASKHGFINLGTVTMVVGVLWHLV